MAARKLKLTIEYDGTDFAGWQVQPDQRTVQGVLEAALADLVGEPSAVTGAGRTDAGVHALGQVAHAQIGSSLHGGEIAGALNARLPDDVLVKGVKDVPEAFHARFSAVSRNYVYLIGLSESPLWRKRRWVVRSSLSTDAMREALGALRGKHDFSSFCLTGSEAEHHRCRVEGISLQCDDRYGGMVILEIQANRFLRGMVRSIVGTLVEVGRGKLPAGEIPSILEAADRARAGPTAPPWGLYLTRVAYE